MISFVRRLSLCVLTVLLAAGAAGVVQAQTATRYMPPSRGGDPTVTMPNPMADVTDYSILSNPVFDYVDLRQAQARGYSPNEIASIAKIATLTGYSFPYVLRQVQSGRTFALLASDYGLKLGDVLDASDERARIDQYMAAYESLLRVGHEQYPTFPIAQVDQSGATLTELEARYNQLNAAFPALPPTNIETTAIGTETTTTTTVAAPPVVAPPPPPEPPAPPVVTPPVVTPPTVVVHHTRHHGHHRRYGRYMPPRGHRHRHAPSYLTHRGS